MAKTTTEILRKIIVLITASFLSMDLCGASPAGTQSQVCNTPGCIEAAQLVLKNMDITANPCYDFYQFACGKFMKEKDIPEDDASVSLFDEKADLLEYKIKQKIEEKMEESDPKTFQSLQSFYNVCLNTEKIEKTSMEEVKEMLNKLGNWPVVFGKLWNASNFEWKQLTYEMRKIGYTDSMRSIVKFDIEFDQKNTTRYIITLDQAATGIEQEYLSKGTEEKIVQAYYKYMVEIAKILGADHRQADKELAESLNFEIGLAKISLAKEERRNMSQLYNIKTVRQLQSEYPNIPWYEYLNEMVSPQAHVGLADEVNVKVPNFLKSLSQLISKTPKRALANYMIWRVVQESALYMNEQVRKVRAEFYAILTGTNVEKPRWAQCIEYLSDNLPVATGAFYVRKLFDEKSKSDTEKLVNELKKSFKRMLEKIDWMEEETKKTARTKLNFTQAFTAHPDEYLDNEKLDKHFESLKVNADSYLKSHLNINLLNLEYKLKQLRKSDGKADWLTDLRGKVAIVDAFYDPAANSLQIAAGILQGEFFTSTRPNYMNYGAIGFVIGHEFTHGFDDQGSQYDKDGNLVNWWDPKSKEEYLKRAQCIVDQYSNYTAKEVGLHINGKSTLGENIADNGGVKEAYFAYENYERQNGEEPRLPGLPYSPRQMFWISAANVWCIKYRPEALRNYIFTDPHSPGEFRVMGAASNMPEFARDFNCPVGSLMNPVKRCTVW